MFTKQGQASNYSVLSEWSWRVSLSSMTYLKWKFSDSDNSNDNDNNNTDDNNDNKNDDTCKNDL